MSSRTRMQGIYSPGHFSFASANLFECVRGTCIAWLFACARQKGAVTLQEQAEPLEATLADLIVALTEEADRLIQNRRQAHNFIAYVLLNILSHSAPVCHTWH